MAEVYYLSPLGIVSIVEQDGFITKISIGDEEDLKPTTTDVAVLKEAIQQLEEYFAGVRREFDLPLRQPGSAFQQTVWQELLRIPYGSTITYGQQSQKMNNPLGIRAIAAANGRNNLWIVVPCHRVLGSNGSLTGYAGGLWRKKWLLEHEANTLGVGQTILAF